MQRFMLFCFGICLSFAAQSRQSAAIDSLRGVLQMHSDAKDTLYVMALNDLAFKYYSISPDTVLQLTERSLATASALDYDAGIMAARRVRGIGFWAKGNYPQALDQFQQGLPLAEATGNPRIIASFVGNIGNIYNLQEQYEKALPYYEQALALQRQIGDGRGIAISLNNIASILSSKEEYDRALDYFQQCLAMREAENDEAGIASVSESIASIFIQQERYEEALALSQKAYSIELASNQLRLQAYSLINQAEAYQGLGNAKKASEAGQKALKISREAGMKKEAKDASSLLSTLYEQTGQYAKALHFHKLFKTYQDSLLNEASQNETGRLETQYEYEKRLLVQELMHKETQAAQQLELEENRYVRNLVLIALACIAAIALFVFFNNTRLRRTRRLLREKNTEIRQQQEALSIQAESLMEANEQMAAGIRYAQTIQQAVLPMKEELDTALGHHKHFSLFMPKDVVSGDFYWLSQLTDDNGTPFVFLAVGDCTGHGVPGGFMSAIGHTMLNEIVNEKKRYAPDAILEELDVQIQRALRQDEELNSDGMDMAICRLEPKKDGYTVIFAGAKRPLYYWNGHEVEVIAGTKRGVGGQQRRDRPFETVELSFDKGHRMYLASDGYIDQNNPKRKKFGTSRFLKTLADSVRLPIPEQGAYLSSSLAQYQQNAEQRDDIAIVGVEA